MALLPPREVEVDVAGQLTHLLATYGYFAVAGIIMLESMGLPLPGETTLVSASIYAGATHNMRIWLVIVAAVAGAVLGDNIGYWVGEKLGYRVLLCYGAPRPRLRPGRQGCGAPIHNIGAPHRSR